ncbi:MAG: hypothetical protein PVI62_15650 [Desulfobacterales bacterium]
MKVLEPSGFFAGTRPAAAGAAFMVLFKSVTFVFKITVNCGENMKKKCGDYRDSGDTYFLSGRSFSVLDKIVFGAS